MIVPSVAPFLHITAAQRRCRQVLRQVQADRLTDVCADLEVDTLPAEPSRHVLAVVLSFAKQCGSLRRFAVPLPVAVLPGCPTVRSAARSLHRQLANTLQARRDLRSDRSLPSGSSRRRRIRVRHALIQTVDLRLHAGRDRQACCIVSCAVDALTRRQTRDGLRQGALRAMRGSAVQPAS